MNYQSAIPQSSLQGTLFELMARGRKDTYFMKDASNSDSVQDGSRSESHSEQHGSWEPKAPRSDSAFNPFYKASTPLLQERRTETPLNAPQFGNSFEIEINKYGDVLTECNLLIDLPSWLPPLPFVSGGTTLPPIQANSQYWITDVSGFSYGYTPYIGLFLFERIEFYQDSALVQQWSGDELFALQATEGSWNTTYLGNQQLGGVDQGIVPGRNIAFRATPGRLRVSLPLPGLQTPEDGGFPLCCVQLQSYRFRIKLRKLEDLIVSDSGAYKPNPFATPFQYYLPGGSLYRFAPVARESVGQPTILLETLQAYIDPDVRLALQNTKQSIPFRRPFENVFTFGEADYTSLDVSSVAASSRRLDACHPVERLVLFFRTANALDRNEYTNFVNPGSVDGQFYNALKLIIAGRDREFKQSALVWQDLMAYAKDEIDSGYPISEMRWNLGDIYNQQRPFSRVPNGSINFTTADRPTLYVQLNNTPVQTISQQRKTELRVFMEGWNVYEVVGGRGRLLFAN
uniref:Major capsid protein N-terminal domain-containing protein n=1 Tax=viral metagenome TaxID=1070528 RepID=A0A6C0K368_9ZZZZ